MHTLSLSCWTNRLSRNQMEAIAVLGYPSHRQAGGGPRGRRPQRGDSGAPRRWGQPSKPGCQSITPHTLRFPTWDELRAGFTRSKGKFKPYQLCPTRNAPLFPKLKCICRQKTFSWKQLCQYAIWAQRKGSIWMHVNAVGIQVVQTVGDSCVLASATRTLTSPVPPGNQIAASQGCSFPCLWDGKRWGSLLFSGFLGQEELI